MGYTFLYSGHLERTIQLYHMMPDLVKLIIADGDNAFDCFLDDENCVLSRQNPDGIPAWKMFSFNFWPRSETPLGRKWTLSPEDVSCCSTIYLWHPIYLHGSSALLMDTLQPPTSVIVWNIHVWHNLSSSTKIGKIVHTYWRKIWPSSGKTGNGHGLPAFSKLPWKPPVYNSFWVQPMTSKAPVHLFPAVSQTLVLWHNRPLWMP